MAHYLMIRLIGSKNSGLEIFYVQFRHNVNGLMINRSGSVGDGRLHIPVPAHEGQT